MTKFIGPSTALFPMKCITTDVVSGFTFDHAKKPKYISAMHVSKFAITNAKNYL